MILGWITLAFLPRDAQPLCPGTTPGVGGTPGRDRLEALPSPGLTDLRFQVKLWRLPAPGQALPSVPGLVLGPEDVQVEVLQFHPTADGILVSAAGTAVKVWDVTKQQALTGMGRAGLPHPGQPPAGRHSVSLCF